MRAEPAGAAEGVTDPGLFIRDFQMRLRRDGVREPRASIARRNGP